MIKSDKMSYKSLFFKKKIIAASVSIVFPGFTSHRDVHVLRILITGGGGPAECIVDLQLMSILFVLERV